MNECAAQLIEVLSKIAGYQAIGMEYVIRICLIG